MKKLNNKNNGITLVALVVTIIILVILTGVSISTLGGENGILEKVKLAKQNYQNAQVEENAVLNKYENKIDEEFSIIATRENISRTPLIDSPVEITATTSWTTPNKEIHLKNSIQEYKYIEFDWDTYHPPRGYVSEKTDIINLEILKFNPTNDFNITYDNSSFGFRDVGYDIAATAWFKTSNILLIHEIKSTYTSNLRIKNIYGIN